MTYTKSRSGEIIVGPFPKGMNNKAKPHALPEGTARNIVNGDIDDQGKISRRQGLTKVYNGLGTKCGFNCPVGEFFVEENSLKKLHTDNSSSVLYRGIFGSTFTYEYFDGIVYFSDGLVCKQIVSGIVLPWGLPSPSKPVLSESSGELSPGVYLASYSWVDSSGTESGASDISTILLTSEAGISFNVLPGVVPGATALRIYLSTPNGSELYHVVDTLDASFTLTSDKYDDGNVLELSFVSSPPPGSIIRIYKGRMYIVTGKIIWYSEPYSFSHFKLGESFLQFPYETTVMEPVDSGIFLANDRETFFYSGTPEEGFNITTKFNYGGLSDTGRKILGTSEVTWLSKRGVIVGSADGQCKNIQEANVATESGTSGATLVREQDGIKRIIACINDPQPSSLAATSFIEAEIIRRAI